MVLSGGFDIKCAPGCGDFCVFGTPKKQIPHIAPRWGVSGNSLTAALTRPLYFSGYFCILCKSMSGETQSANRRAASKGSQIEAGQSQPTDKCSISGRSLVNMPAILQTSRILLYKYTIALDIEIIRRVGINSIIIDQEMTTLIWPVDTF